MKIFVSGQINDTEYVQGVQQALISAGHTITHDWTFVETGSQFLGSREAKFANLEESGVRARKDIQGVVDCDVYIICTDNEEVGKGMYVELGAALALNTSTNSPIIYLLGNMEHVSIFYLHPEVNRKNNVDEIIEDIKSNINDV